MTGIVNRLVKVFGNGESTGLVRLVLMVHVYQADVPPVTCPRAYNQFLWCTLFDSGNQWLLKWHWSYCSCGGLWAAQLRSHGWCWPFLRLMHLSGISVVGKETFGPSPAQAMRRGRYEPGRLKSWYSVDKRPWAWSWRYLFLRGSSVRVKKKN